MAVQKGAFLEGETAGQETRERLPVLREPERMGLWEEPGIHTGDRHVPDPEESVVEMQERALLESGGL